MSTDIEKAKSNTVLLLDDKFVQGTKQDIEEFSTTGKRFAELTLRIGLRLEFAKQQLPHGQLQKWIDQNIGFSKMHALRCRKLAQVFIATQKIKEGEAFALVDPEHSKASLAKKLEQMAFDFIADKTQAELFAEHGIAVRESKKISIEQPPKRTPEEAEAAAVDAIRNNWKEMASWLNNEGLEGMSWAELDEAEIRGLQALFEGLASKIKSHLNTRR